MILSNSPDGQQARRQVLVVEDDEAVRDAIAAVLLDERYEPLCASDGYDALELLWRKETRPGLIVLDLMLPMMNGPAFASAVRDDAQLRDVPILVVSADPDIHEVSRAIGAAAVLPKPFDVERFSDLVRATYRGATEPLPRTSTPRVEHSAINVPRDPPLKVLVIDESERGLRDAGAVIAGAGHEVVGSIGLIGIGAALEREAPDVVVIGPSTSVAFHARLSKLLRARGAPCVMAAVYGVTTPQGAATATDGIIFIGSAVVVVDRALRRTAARHPRFRDNN